jgi:hypothetical protein
VVIASRSGCEHMGARPMRRPLMCAARFSSCRRRRQLAPSLLQYFFWQAVKIALPRRASSRHVMKGLR